MQGLLTSSVPAGAATSEMLAARGSHALVPSGVGDPARQSAPGSAVQLAGGRAGLGARESAAATPQLLGSALSQPVPGGERQGEDAEQQQQVITGEELEKLRTVHFMMYQHVQVLQQHIKELHASFEPEVWHF